MGKAQQMKAARGITQARNIEILKQFTPFWASIDRISENFNKIAKFRG